MTSLINRTSTRQPQYCSYKASTTPCQPSSLSHLRHHS
nr:MAG TPA: hypothetical protein [Caudoviricetes sp.]